MNKVQVRRMMAVMLISGSLWTNGAYAAVCVGKFLLDLPADVDVALPKHDYMIWTNPNANASNHANYVLIDETKTPAKNGSEAQRETTVWGSNQGIAHKELISGREMSRQEFAQFKIQAFRQTKESILISGSLPEDDRVKKLDFEKNTGTDSFAINHRLYLWRGGRIFAAAYGDWQAADTVQWAVLLDKKLSARRMDEVPAKNGLCLNMGFIEEGRLALAPSLIAVTFRWKSHPEVEIFFRDESMAANEAQTDVNAELVDFWESYYQENVNKRRLLNSPVPGVVAFPERMLGGIKGRESRIETIYEDGKTDYGYLVYAAGEVKDKPDRSDLMLYVIRNASRAKGTPMGKDEFMAFADKIAASVRRRVVPPAAELRGKNE